MLKNYIAVYRNSENQIRTMKEKYNTMKNFKQDLRRNGYKVILVLTENNIKQIEKTDKFYNLNLKKFDKIKDYSLRESIFNYIKEDLI